MSWLPHRQLRKKVSQFAIVRKLAAAQAAKKSPGGQTPNQPELAAAQEAKKQYGIDGWQ